MNALQQIADLTNQERGRANDADLARPHLIRALRYLLSARKSLKPDRRGIGNHTAAAIIPMVRECLDRAESHLPKD